MSRSNPSVKILVAEMEIRTRNLENIYASDSVEIAFGLLYKPAQSTVICGHFYHTLCGEREDTVVLPAGQKRYDPAIQIVVACVNRACDRLEILRRRLDEDFEFEDKTSPNPHPREKSLRQHTRTLRRALHQ